MSDPDDVLGLDPADLDGHTLEQLGDYLDRGLEPADPSIDESPACQMALAALIRLRTIAAGWLDRPEPGEPERPAWIAALPVQVSRGRLFPLPTGDPDVDAAVTEGALRGLIQTVGDGVPGLLTGRIRLDVHPADADPGHEEADVLVEIAVVYGVVLADVERDLRRTLRAALVDQAPFAIGRIDLRVVDVIGPRPAGERRDG